MTTYLNNNVYAVKKNGESSLSNANKWIKSILDNLDENVDKETRIEVLEECGRNCCRSSGFYKKAQKSMSKAKDRNEFLDSLRKVWSNLKKEGEDVYVVYEKCYCPLGRALSKDYPMQLSSFCNCSRGWIREMFESALKRPVKVELEKSIIRRDDFCRFKVTL